MAARCIEWIICLTVGGSENRRNLWSKQRSNSNDPGGHRDPPLRGFIAVEGHAIEHVETPDNDGQGDGTLSHTHTFALATPIGSQPLFLDPPTDATLDDA